MSELSHEQKIFIVKGLAQFSTPTEVVKLVKEEFQIEVSRQAVRYYIPDQSPQLAEEWRVFFQEERKKAIDQIGDIGTAHKNVRLRELDDMYRRAKGMNNLGLAKDILEQVAKEEGGAFTNKRELSGPQGSAIPVSVVDTINKIYGDGGEFSGENESEGQAGGKGQAAGESQSGGAAKSKTKGKAESSKPASS